MISDSRYSTAEIIGAIDYLKKMNQDYIIHRNFFKRGLSSKVNQEVKICQKIKSRKKQF